MNSRCQRGCPQAVWTHWFGWSWRISIVVEHPHVNINDVGLRELDPLRGTGLGQNLQRDALFVLDTQQRLKTDTSI